MSSLTPRVILITGASAGIGRACAIALSEAFSPLVLILSGRREGALHSTAKECREGTTTEVVAGDVSKEEDVIKMFGLVKEKYGPLDVVFNVSASNEMRIELMRAPYFFSFCLLLLPRAIVCHHKTQNAGVDLLNAVPLEEADMSKFCQVIDVNIMAAVLCTKEAIKIMKSQSPPGGRIINNGSISAHSPRPDSAAYTVSKHAILGLSRSTSLDGRKYNITATQLDIGNAQTAMGGHAAKGCRQADGSMRTEPMMNVGNVAKTVVFLCGLEAAADVPSLQILASGMPFVGRG